MLLGRCPLLFATLLVAASPAHGQNTTPLFSTNEAALVRPCDGLREPETPCRLPIMASPDVLRAIAATSNADITGDTVTFVVDAASVRSMTMVGGLRLSLEQIPGTTLWGARVFVPRMREAIISFRFLTDTSTAVPARRSVRGSAAPPRPLRSAELHGSLRVDTLNSVALAMPREIISYVPRTSAADRRLPVIYLADGAAVRDLAPMVDTLIASGRLSPMLLVGVRAARSVPDMSETALDRAREYVYGFESDSARFLAHETFFVDEVSAWAEQTLMAADSRAGRSVWGASNGAAFAVAMGLRHPTHYEQVIAASPVYASIPQPAAHGRLPRFLLSAGSFERIIQQTTSVLAETLRDLGASARFEVFSGGHDDLLWSEALVRNLVSPVTALRF